MTRFRNSLITLSAAGLLLLLAACSRPALEATPPATRSMTDGLGRSVQIVARPQRIVSLAPNITEILFALGLEDRVVAVTSYCDYPESTTTKPKVGDTLRPDLERIIALKPDLVLITTSSQLETLTRRMDQLGVPVYVSNPRDIQEIVASIRAIGEATGAAPRADEIAREMERRIADVRRRVGSLPRPRTLYVLQASPLITAGRNTFITDLIRLAGGTSISEDEKADYPQFSRETVIARAPDVIVAPGSHGTETVREEDLRKDFATTPAIRANRIVRVNPDWVDRPGPRIVEGLEQLAQGLHPGSP
ncbi:MAG: cobalamin-binding protein [Blastocatellia bacterium]|nr:cobalamin-binding protein [Blastocatellia bacterium]